FFFNYTSTTEIYPLSLHDALPIYPSLGSVVHEFPDGWTMRSCDNTEQCYDEGEEMNHCGAKYAPLVEAKTHQLFSLRDPENHPQDRKSTRLNSSHVAISYAVFCLK